MGKPVVDVLYVTYAKDAEWFKHSIEVLVTNLSGWRRIIVVCPRQDEDLIREQLPKDYFGGPIVVQPIEDWPGKGYYWQQWVKMSADTFSDAPYIMHIDSDVFIKESCDVSEFFVNGKPAWMWAYYTDLEGVPWQKSTEEATQLICDREFMQAFPFCIDRKTYEKVRSAIQERHNLYTDGYAKAMATIPGPSMSEFNIMGAISYEFLRNRYFWVDRNRDDWPSGFHKSRQFWSRAPMKDHLGAIQQMLYGGDEPELRTTERGWWVLTNDTHISRWVEQRGKLDFDTPFLNKILAFIKPGDVVVDVGAFIGDHTHAYAKATAGVDAGKVLAFEPNDLPYEALVRNMRAHGHVECIKKAVGASAGKLSIAQDPNVGASHLVHGDDIDVVTIDSYQLYACDLIKVDAEGMEFSVLQGAWWTIAT